MSTTHIQPLPNVYGRMAYTELGEGKKRTENIQNGTNRIAAQMGDGDSREEFVRFCSAMKRQNQGRENEGFEVRVSWAPEELSKDDPEDIQRACEYGYLLCKEVAPNAPCWVTVHTDGGAVYMGREWREACGPGVVRSMSRRARSPDNARAEGFFGTLKCDFFEGRDWTGVPFDEFSRLLGEYIEWYRDGKLKKDLGWKTIREYREERGYAA